MPPTPKIITELNPERYIDACNDLGLCEGRPVVRFVKKKTEKISGTYNHAARTVTVYADLAMYARDRLPFVHTEIALTILHELRHAWQYELENMPEIRKATSKVPGHPDHTKVEADAEGWARQNLSRFRGIVRVKRKHHGGGLSRLAATERTVR